jgi:hypothetical protein
MLHIIQLSLHTGISFTWYDTFYNLAHVSQQLTGYFTSNLYTVTYHVVSVLSPNVK